MSINDANILMYWKGFYHSPYWSETREATHWVSQADQGSAPRSHDLNLLNLFTNNNRIGLAYLLLPELTVIKGALMFVRVTMEATIETPTAALKTCEANFLFAGVTAILLGFLVRLWTVAGTGCFGLSTPSGGSGLFCGVFLLCSAGRDGDSWWGSLYTRCSTGVDRCRLRGTGHHGARTRLESIAAAAGNARAEVPRERRWWGVLLPPFHIVFIALRTHSFKCLIGVESTAIATQRWRLVSTIVIHRHGHYFW